jgi:D-arabinose 1-dehydrogenase-like Zn-dependent alcohol dehydrogenase
MKAAAVVRQFGEPLVLEDRPIPAPGPGQVCVRMLGRTRVIHEARNLADINDSIEDVLHGRARARIVLEP